MKRFGSLLAVTSAQTSDQAKRRYLMQYSIVYRARRGNKARSHFNELRVKKQYLYANQRTIWLSSPDYFRPQIVTIALVRKPNKMENTYQVIRRLK